ncbi:MAG: antibiotic biosynthesis monooxygenase [bacterium]|nr:antibiotic biosynthesis monooxygenase [bacterium]
MVSVAILATLQAKPDKVTELSDMLKSAVELAQAEELTISWYALQMGETTFGIFDTFEDEAGRQAHLNGQIAAALMEHADELLSEPPKIEHVTILAAK